MVALVFIAPEWAPLAALAPSLGVAVAPLVLVPAVPVVVEWLGMAGAVSLVIAALAGGASVVLAARSLGIPLDLPAAGKAAGAIARRLNKPDATGMPPPPLKFRLRKPQTVDGEDSPASDFPAYPGMPAEGAVITFDLIAVVVGVVAGAVALRSPAWGSVGLLVAVAGLQFQERIPPRALIPAAIAALGAYFPDLVWLFVVLPFLSLSEAREDVEVTALPETPPDPAQVWLEGVLERVRTAASQQALPETPVRVGHGGTEGIQEIITVDISDQPAPPAFLKRVASSFGDLEFAVGRRSVSGESRYVLLVVNPHIRPPAVTAETFISAAREIPAGQLLVGFTSFGEPMTINLEERPHLGVWGGSGTGKSVTMRTAVLGGTLFNSPTEVGIFAFDPKAVTFAGLDFASIYGLYTLPLQIVAATIVALEEARRRMRAMSAMGVEKFSEYNARSSPDQRLALCVLAFEELEFLQQQTESSQTGTPKKPGVLTPLLFEDSAPYTPEEQEELTNLLPRTFFAQPTLWQVFINALRQLLAVARACGLHAVLCTQTPQASIVPATARGNLSCHLMHRLPESVGGVVRNVLGGDKDIMPWHIPAGVKGLFVMYPETTMGRGVYIPIEDVQELVRGRERPRLPLLIAQDPAIVSPEAVRRYRRIDEYLLNRQVAEGTMQPDTAAGLLERWYSNDAVRALTEGVPLPPGMMIDLALRVPMSV